MNLVELQVAQIDEFEEEQVKQLAIVQFYKTLLLVLFEVVLVVVVGVVVVVVEPPPIAVPQASWATPAQIVLLHGIEVATAKAAHVDFNWSVVNG